MSQNDLCPAFFLEVPGLAQVSCQAPNQSRAWGWSAMWPGLSLHLAWPWRGTPSRPRSPRWRRPWPQTSWWRGQTAPRREAEFSCPDPTGNVLQPQTARPPETVQPQLGPGSLPGFTCRSLCLPLPPLPRGGVHLAAQAGTDLRGESAVSPVLRKAPGPRQGAFLWSDPACCRLPHGTSLGPVSQPPGAEVPFSL